MKLTNTYIKKNIKEVKNSFNEELMKLKDPKILNDKKTFEKFLNDIKQNLDDKKLLFEIIKCSFTYLYNWNINFIDDILNEESNPTKTKLIEYIKLYIEEDIEISICLRTSEINKWDNEKLESDFFTMDQLKHYQSEIRKITLDKWKNYKGGQND